MNGLTLDDIDPQAVVANFSDDGTDDWMVVFGDHVKVWTMTNGAIPDSTPYWESGDLENLRGGLREKKTLDFLIQHAKVSANA